LATDLERSESRRPRIKDLRDLFVTPDRTPVQSANKSVRSRFGVNTAENVGAPNPDQGSTQPTSKGVAARSRCYGVVPPPSSVWRRAASPRSGDSLPRPLQLIPSFAPPRPVFGSRPARLPARRRTSARRRAAGGAGRAPPGRWDATLKRVRALLPDQQVVELIGTIAGYNMVSRFLVATGVDAEGER